MISRSTYVSWILMTTFCVNDFPTIFLLTGQNFQTGPGVAIAFWMTIVLIIISVAA
jgi:multiple sugar transport system permease protein